MKSLQILVVLLLAFAGVALLTVTLVWGNVIAGLATVWTVFYLRYKVAEYDHES